MLNNPTYFKDYYWMLGIPFEATSAEIDQAYWRCLEEVHPAIHPEKPKLHNQLYLLIWEAYTTLSHPTQRKIYDKQYTTAVLGYPEDTSGVLILPPSAEDEEDKEDDAPYDPSQIPVIIEDFNEREIYYGNENWLTRKKEWLVFVGALIYIIIIVIINFTNIPAMMGFEVGG